MNQHITFPFFRTLFRLMLLTLFVPLLAQSQATSGEDDESGRDILPAVVSTHWNGFFRMANVISLIANTSSPTEVDLRLFDRFGSLLSATRVLVPGDRQVDIPISFLPGFIVGDYGTLEVESMASQLAAVQYAYKLEDRSPNVLEFVKAGLVRDYMTGTSYVLFNTYMPGRAAVSSALPVFNWLEVSNGSSAAALFFDIDFLDENGALLQTNSYGIPPHARLDLQAGHEFPGNNRVGMIRIRPSNPAQPYLVQLSRYAAKDSAAVARQSYVFASERASRSGSDQEQFLFSPMSDEALSWLVVANTSAASGLVTVDVVDLNGVLRGQVQLALGPYAQRHLFASGFLQNGVPGMLRVRPPNGLPVLAELDVYYFDADLNVTAAHASISSTLSALPRYTAFNTFFSFENHLAVFNTRAVASSVLTRWRDYLGALQQETLVLGAMQGVMRSSANYGFPSNTYGSVRVEDMPVPAVSFAQYLRLQRTSTGVVRAAEALPLR